MMNQQILTKAIEKAIDGGLDPHTFHSLPITSFRLDGEVGTLGVLFESRGEAIDVATVIYNHNFAKALWGNTKVDLHEGKLGKYFSDDPFIDIGFEGALWQYHLQQMVIEKNPIKYLGENI